MSFTKLVWCDDLEQELEVDFSVFGGCSGSYDGWQQISPDEPPEIEVEKVTDEDGNDVSDSYADADWLIDSLYCMLEEIEREMEIDRQEAKLHSMGL